MNAKRVAAASLIASLLVPALAFAETSLRETIRGALLSDPRTQGMQPEQVEAMVDLLSMAAQAKGITADDIAWRPTSDTFKEEESACGTGFFCKVTDAFGFTGSDHTIAIWLGACSLLLVFLIGFALEEHHRKGKRARVTPPRIQ